MPARPPATRCTQRSRRRHGGRPTHLAPCLALALLGGGLGGAGRCGCHLPGVAPPPAAPGRRALVLGGAVGGAGGSLARAAGAQKPVRISVPLSLERGAFYLDFWVENERFRAVVDTGSPFALVAACTGERKAQGRCEEFCVKYGCADGLFGQPAGLPDNDIAFSGAITSASWRRGRVALGGISLGELRFGVLTEVRNLGGNAGGPNFGLIRTATSDPAIRPTFLSQTPYTAFAVDLRRPGAERLDLLPDLGPQVGVRLPVTDLRPYGAPVEYYAVRVRDLWFDDYNVLDGDKGREVVAVLDTGTTGLAMPQSLFAEYLTARRNAAAAAAAEGRVGRFKHGNIRIGLEGEPEDLVLRRGANEEYGGARFDSVVYIPEVAGTVFNRAEEQDPNTKRPIIVFLGLGFLLGRRLGIDTEAGVATLQA